MSLPLEEEGVTALRSGAWAKPSHRLAQKYVTVQETQSPATAESLKTRLLDRRQSVFQLGSVLPVRSSGGCAWHVCRAGPSFSQGFFSVSRQTQPGWVGELGHVG